MRKKLDAFYTPEAALVLLISLFSLFTLIFLTFYLHDVQSLQAEMNRLTDRAAAENWTEEKILEESQQQLMSEDCRLFFLRVEELDVYQEAGDRVLTAEVRFPIPQYAERFFQKVVRFGQVKSSISRHEPEMLARQTEAVKEIIE